MQIITCPICWRTIYSHDDTPLQARASIPSHVPPEQRGRLILAMAAEMEDYHRRSIEEAETACREHFETEHALRFKVAWRYPRLRWMMKRKWPWSKPPQTLPDFRFPA